LLRACRHVRESLSDGLDEPLTGFAKLRLRLHLVYCPACRRVARSLERTVELLGQLKDDEGVNDPSADGP
jgi:predicted anti-sigma-YlaC factor YlaD